MLVCAGQCSVDVRGGLPRADYLLGVAGGPGGLHHALAFFGRHGGRLQVMAVNDRIGPMGSGGQARREYWPERLDVAGSAHAGLLHSWLEGRELAGLNRPAHVVAVQESEAATCTVRPLNFCLGSSGMLPVVAGRLLMGCRAVILAGVSMGGRYGRRYLRAWNQARSMGLLAHVYHLGPSRLVDEGILRAAPERFQITLEAT
jgi:hypothetical protein